MSQESQVICLCTASTHLKSTGEAHNTFGHPEQRRNNQENMCVGHALVLQTDIGFDACGQNHWRCSTDRNERCSFVETLIAGAAELSLRNVSMSCKWT